ncbi:MAG: metallophosphoesterase [Planctomycetota bacterium]
MKNARALVFGDMHVPYHSERWFGWLFDLIEDWNPTHLICDGDALEASPPSTHAHESSSTAEDEFREAERYLSALAEIRPNTKRVWLHGNHDHRYLEADPRRVPKAYRSLCNWNRIAPRLAEWQQVPYGHDGKCCYQLGQLVVRHGVKVGSGAIREDHEFNHMTGGYAHRLFVSGHTHTSEAPHQLKIGGASNGVESNVWRANTGTLADVDKLNEAYANRFSTYRWGPAVLLWEGRIGRACLPGREWDAELRRPA